ncbi:SCO1664 family protein [Saxibacter everestensis]|uniref:SCO1664 family protein n=1 Tax=Saxibacter everestensis TaxID=2909229 RepID=A0ABY8QZ53_9MICO|nr:SCO1664 family protein [Brevibacteriaceae bacterium ZFBP1038]
MATVTERTPVPPTPTGPQPATIQAVYKPIAGERPLHDFPDGTLAGREWAAYQLSEALGWDIVAPTVIRDDLPFGRGSLQAWIESGPHTDPLVDTFEPDELPEAWLPVLAAETPDGQPLIVAHSSVELLRRIALFDALANNADRKGTHLISTRHNVVGIDHGLAFHRDDKLRTVLWGFAGSPLEDGELSDLTELAERWSALAKILGQELSDEEVSATAGRLTRLIDSGHFPSPGGSYRDLPWPPL